MVSVYRLFEFFEKNAVKDKMDLSKVKPHGVNPCVTDSAAGVTVELPRFSSPEMQMARQMNKIAIRNIRTFKLPSYPNASALDLKRLTSNAIEDTYSRVEWTNPKDGKFYNILKQGETKDGKVIVRILDEQGAFVKEAELTPKTITIADSFDLYDSTIPHGVVVETYARRNNPFARYNIVKFTTKLDERQNQKVDFNEASIALNNALESNKTDYLSLSLANHLHTTNARPLPYKDTLAAVSELDTKNLEVFEKVLQKFVSKNTRVLIGSGNNGEMGLNSFLAKVKGAEGVGALSPFSSGNRVKIAKYSASRNSGYTQHYEEIGCKTIPVYNDGKLAGFNITGKPGCDISVETLEELLKEYKDNIQKELNALISKKTMLDEEYEAVKLKHEKIKDKILEEKRKVSFENFFEDSIAIDRKYKPEEAKLCDEMSDLYSDSQLYKQKIRDLSCNLNDINIESFLLDTYWGTSLSTPARAAKLALNDMMEGVL